MNTNKNFVSTELTQNQLKIFMDVKSGLNLTFGDDLILEVLHANSWNKIGALKKLEEISDFCMGKSLKLGSQQDFPKYSNNLKQPSQNYKLGATPKQKHWRNDFTPNDKLLPHGGAVPRVNFKQILSLNKEEDRIIRCIQANIKVMVLMRGCSGSGKSTLAKSILKNFPSLTIQEHIFSSDDFFTNRISGYYNFRPDLLEQAHEWNRSNVETAVKHGRTPVIVDNTNTMIWEMAEYAKMAVKFGYSLEVLEPSTPWFFDAKVLKKKSMHNVPLKSIENMLSRYNRNVSGSSLLQSLKLSYKPGKLPPQFSHYYQPTKGLPSGPHQTNLSVSNDLMSFDEVQIKENVPVTDPCNSFTGILSFEDFVKANEQLCSQTDGSEDDSAADNLLLNEDITESSTPEEEEECDQVKNVLFGKPSSNQHLLEDVFSKTPFDSKLNSSSDINTANHPLSQEHVMNSDDVMFQNSLDDVLTSMEECQISKGQEADNEKTQDHALGVTCYEYVLIQSTDDGSESKVVYQNLHDGMPELLEEFRKTTLDNKNGSKFARAGAQESEIFKQNIELMAPKNVNASGRGYSLFNSYEEYRDKCAILSKPSSVGEATLFLGSWDNEVPREKPTNDTVDMPKPQRFVTPQRKSPSCQDAFSNTNYKDFEVLKSVSSGADIDVKIVLGNAWKYIPYSDNAQAVQPQLSSGVDRSTMTTDFVTNQIKHREAGLEKLLKMFPQIPLEDLAELFDKCQKDLDWTVGLLLDSGIDIAGIPEEFEDLLETQEEEEIYQDSSISDSSSHCVSVENKSKKAPKKKPKVVDLSTVMCHDVQKHNRQEVPETSPSFVDPQWFKDSVKQEKPETPSGYNFPNSCNHDESVVIALEKPFVLQLQDLLPNYLTSSVIDDVTLVKVPLNLIKQLQECIMKSVEEQMEEQDIQVVAALLEDEETANFTDRYAMRQQKTPSFQDIMDEQLAINAKQNKSDTRKDDISSKLGLKLLQERFTNMDPFTLTKILEDANHSLHEATVLLTLAGHTPQINASEVPGDTSNTSENEKLRDREKIEKESAILYEQRKTCLEKAHAYYRLGNKGAACYYSEMAKWYKNCFDKAQKVLTECLLNERPSFNTLDLHYLPVNTALRVLDFFIDENVEFLKKTPTANKVVVMIITGRGKNSLDGKSKIKPAVEKRLLKLNIEFEDSNPGMLKATIRRSFIYNPS